jgi:hypothetical protein
MVGRSKESESNCMVDEVNDGKGMDGGGGVVMRCPPNNVRTCIAGAMNNCSDWNRQWVDNKRRAEDGRGRSATRAAV